MFSFERISLLILPAPAETIMAPSLGMKLTPLSAEDKIDTHTSFVSKDPITPPSCRQITDPYLHDSRPASNLTSTIVSEGSLHRRFIFGTPIACATGLFHVRRILDPVEHYRRILQNIRNDDRLIHTPISLSSTTVADSPPYSPSMLPDILAITDGVLPPQPVASGAMQAKKISECLGRRELLESLVGFRSRTISVWRDGTRRLSSAPLSDDSQHDLPGAPSAYEQSSASAEPFQDSPSTSQALEPSQSHVGPPDALDSEQIWANPSVTPSQSSLPVDRQLHLAAVQQNESVPPAVVSQGVGEAPQFLYPDAPESEKMRATWTNPSVTPSQSSLAVDRQLHLAAVQQNESVSPAIVSQGVGEAPQFLYPYAPGSEQMRTTWTSPSVTPSQSSLAVDRELHLSAAQQKESIPPAVVSQCIGEAPQFMYLQDPSYIEYTRLGMLGKGGFGGVILAWRHQEIDGRRQHDKVAIKIIRKGKHFSQDSRQMVVNELQILCDATANPSPFLAKLLQAWEDPHSIYFVTQLCHLDLTRRLHALRIRNERVGQEEARLYCAELILGLNHLHVKLQASHLDLKPDNILIAADGRLVITDFGLSLKPVGHLKDFIMTGVVGTPGYAAPEMCSKDVTQYTYKVDIFSLGLIFAEILGNTGPLYGRSKGPYSHQDQRKEMDETPISWILADLVLDSEDARDLLRQMLKPRPEERPRTEMLAGCKYFSTTCWPWVQSGNIYHAYLPPEPS